MRRLRYRLARALVGPFVNLPERDGVWVVSRMDGGSGTMVVEADKFRMKLTSKLNPIRFASSGTADEIAADFARYEPSRRVGRFVGTVKP